MTLNLSLFWAIVLRNAVSPRLRQPHCSLEWIHFHSFGVLAEWMVTLGPIPAHSSRGHHCTSVLNSEVWAVNMHWGVNTNRDTSCSFPATTALLQKPSGSQVLVLLSFSLPSCVLPAFRLWQLTAIPWLPREYWLEFTLNALDVGVTMSGLIVKHPKTALSAGTLIHMSSLFVKKIYFSSDIGNNERSIGAYDSHPFGSKPKRKGFPYS